MRQRICLMIRTPPDGQEQASWLIRPWIKTLRLVPCFWAPGDLAYDVRFTIGDLSNMLARSGFQQGETGL
jgi:hypothetical protein